MPAINRTTTSNIVSKARKSAKIVLTILLPPVSSSAFSKYTEIVSNNLPLLTVSATSTNVIPTAMDSSKRRISTFSSIVSFFHSGKKQKHNKNNTAVTVSTTSWAKAKSAARNNTQHIATENPTKQFNKTAL